MRPGKRERALKRARAARKDRTPHSDARFRSAWDSDNPRSSMRVPWGDPDRRKDSRIVTIWS